jgi:hypothetical protein
MNRKQALIVVAIALGMLAPVCAIAGDSITCVSKGRNFNTHSLPDGTFCEVDSQTGGKSTAKASSRGQASADDFMFGKATSNASDGGTAEADAQFPKGKAKAIASGDKSSAFAMGVQCPASAVAKTAGNATANCATGKATADASDGGVADAESKFVTNCVVDAKATGANSSSTADCEVDGGFVTVTTTGGGVASGNGVDAPICIPHSGTATVKSFAGNCP